MLSAQERAERKRSNSVEASGVLKIWDRALAAEMLEVMRQL